MDNILEIRLIQNESEYQDILEIRKTVFVREQNVPQAIEFDELDRKSIHVLVKLDKKTIGCARIRVIDEKVKLERIAILKEYRNKGFGKRLMQYLIFCDEARNATEIMVHAQYHLREFYRRLGFKPRGETFLEANIKHIEMYIKI